MTERCRDTMTGDHGEPYACGLDAGHVGEHHDRNGCATWPNADDPAPCSTLPAPGNLAETLAAVVEAHGAGPVLIMMRDALRASAEHIDRTVGDDYRKIAAADDLNRAAKMCDAASTWVGIAERVVGNTTVAMALHVLSEAMPEASAKWTAAERSALIMNADPIDATCPVCDAPPGAKCHDPGPHWRGTWEGYHHDRIERARRDAAAKHGLPLFTVDGELLSMSREALDALVLDRCGPAFGGMIGTLDVGASGVIVSPRATITIRRVA